MKKINIVLIVIFVVLLVGFALWGYIRAQHLKQEISNIKSILNQTPKLEHIEQNDNEIAVDSYEEISKEATSIRNKLGSIDILPEDLRQDIFIFYGAQAEDKYKEAQYLQILNEAQESMGLKSTEPKNKNEILEILDQFRILNEKIEQNNIALGPKYDEKMNRVKIAATEFQESLFNLESKMNDSSPPTQVGSANIDRATDELKIDIIQSLNQYVDLQQEINTQLDSQSQANWVMPINIF